MVICFFFKKKILKNFGTIRCEPKIVFVSVGFWVILVLFFSRDDRGNFDITVVLILGFGCCGENIG